MHGFLAGQIPWNTHLRLRKPTDKCILMAATCFLEINKFSLSYNYALGPTLGTGSKLAKTPKQEESCSVTFHNRTNCIWFPTFTDHLAWGSSSAFQDKSISQVFFPPAVGHVPHRPTQTQTQQQEKAVSHTISASPRAFMSVALSAESGLPPMNLRMSHPFPLDFIPKSPSPSEDFPDIPSQSMPFSQFDLFTSFLLYFSSVVFTVYILCVCVCVFSVVLDSLQSPGL